MKARLLLAAMLVLVAGDLRGQTTRKWLKGAWQETARFDDNIGNRLFNPQRLVLCKNRLVVMDLEDAHVVSFGLDGAFQWRFGRAGGGPGEFRTIGSVACDATGRVWIPDSGNGRVAVVSPEGTLDRATPVKQSVRRLAVVPSGVGWFGLTSSAAGEVATYFDSAGNPRMVIPAPARLRALNAAQRESYIVATSDGGAVIGFRWSSLLLKVSAQGSVVVLHEGIEPVAFADYRVYPTESGGAKMLRIAPDAVTGTEGLAVSGNTLHVLFAGVSDAKGRLVDRYRLSDGAYLGSVSLPFAPQSFAATETTFYALMLEPVPGIRRLEWMAADRE